MKEINYCTAGETCSAKNEEQMTDCKFHEYQIGRVGTTCANLCSIDMCCNSSDAIRCAPKKLKAENKLLFAQDLIKTCNPSVSGGFNMFIGGDSWLSIRGYYDAADGRYQGFEKAKQMAADGKIFYTKVFKCGCGSEEHPFLYGGFFVCNSCGRKKANRDWWVIKVQKDGNAFCCHGLDFVNLQESENYAFGDTINDAIAAYEVVMNEATP